MEVAIQGYYKMTGWVEIHVLLAGLKPWQKVGGEPRPGSGQTATEMTHHGLNQSLISYPWCLQKAHSTGKSPQPF